MEFMSRAIELAGIYFTTGVRWFFLILSIFILARQIRSLLQARNPSEIWAYLGCPDDTTVPLTHWENLIGRSRGCDVILNLNSVSRSHGTLIRDSDGVWKYNDLNSKNGSAINGVPVKEPTILKAGDVLTIGGSDFTLYPVSLEERMANIEKRKKRTHPVSPWPSLVALTLFQFLMCVQFKVALGEDFPPQLPFAVGLLCILMWTYVIIMRFFKRVGFEMEIIAFYLSTLSLAVTASAYPSTVLKQSICICLGVGLFFGLCWFLRDLNRAKRIVYIMMGISVLLLIINLAFGTMKYGASNWVSIGGMSIQPSELVKSDLPITSTPTISCRQKPWLWQKKSQPTHPLPYAMQNVPSTKGHRQTSMLPSRSRTNGFPNALLHKIKRKACRHSSKNAKQHSSISSLSSLQIKSQDCMKRKAANSWLKMD